MNASFIFAAMEMPGGSRDWAWTHEGISPGWAALTFVVLMAGTLFAYLKFAPAMPRWRRAALIILRGCVIAIFLILLVKPAADLTVNEPVRQGLLVLVDTSQSLALQDKRERPEDLARAAIAAGMASPGGGLSQSLPGDAATSLAKITRWDLLQKLAANDKLNLWSRLSQISHLEFFQFGRNATAAGTIPSDEQDHVSAADAVNFFRTLRPNQPATAIGDSLREVLQAGHNRPVSGILLITDGGNNAGSSPMEAAQLAKAQNIPLFIYGVGVASPPDLVVESVDAPKLAFVKERIEVRAHLRSQGISDPTVVATLKADGKEVDRQTATFDQNGDGDVTFRYEPQDAGSSKLQVSLPVLPQEVSKENNTATATLRVTDSKFQVLLIEQEPRWDFRYLLAYLQRDRRLEVHCVMIDGEPGIDKEPDSPFLPALPDDRETYFRSQVLILGDVDPGDLGQERMNIIHDWVQAGGGIIFLAGPKFNPSAYVGTPLESLLPVVPDTTSGHDFATQRTPEPFKLELTSLGETSPYLQMSNDPDENRRIWDEFAGVRWTAPVERPKPGAEVLLVDPRPERVGRYGPAPVFVMQEYGSGTCVYIGTDETYRWRSHVGEKYYSTLWGQIMQSLSLQLLQGASSKTQLRADRSTYSPGDKVIISGNIYTEGYNPLVAPSVDGTMKFEPADSTVHARQQPLPVVASPDGGFRAEFVPQAPGEYSYSTARDQGAVVKFEVAEPHVEQLQTSLNDSLLKAMAIAGGGRFLREEDLDQFPRELTEHAATAASFQKVDLYYSLWWPGALFTFLFLEWLLRKLTQLK